MLRRAFWRYGLPLSGRLGYRVGRAANLLTTASGWSRAQMASHQGEALHRLMVHCYANVPYYSDVMRARKLTPGDFRSTEDLAKLPWLTRDDLRTHHARLRSRIHPDSACILTRSGGTTGEPVTVAIDSEARAYEMAAYVRGFEWMGHQWGNSIVQLFGGSLGLARQSWRTAAVNELFNVTLLPAFELRPETLSTYTQAIDAAPGCSLVSYASSAFNLATYAKDIDWAPRISTVITTAEQMPELWRLEIERVLKAPVFSYYGCNEVGSIGYQHRDHDGYLVTEELAIVEVAGASSHVASVGEGPLAVTSLFNYAMPIVRYVNGDRGRIGHAESGLARQRIFELHGRVVDQLLDFNGRPVGGSLPSHLVLKAGVPLTKYQVIQEKLGHVIFRYDPANAEAMDDHARNRISEVFRRHLGNDTVVEFAIGGFELSTSGKYRVVISRVNSN